MVAATPGNHKKYPSRRIYKSNLMNAFSAGSGKVIVEVKSSQKVTDEPGTGGYKSKRGKINDTKFLERTLNVRFQEEVDQLVRAYRTMLRESMVKGDNKELKKALTRARLQEKTLANTAMADQAQACELLGLSSSNASSTMKRKEDKNEVLRFTFDGRAAYPLFQFDIDERRIFPVVIKLIEMKPDNWSNFRLLYWLTRPHAEFEDTPADALRSDHDAVISAFERAIQPVEHG